MNTTRHCILGCALLVAACDETSNGAGIAAATHDGYFAVLSTNYTGATSISLLGRDGAVVDNEWVGSKTENPDLRTPLSEDVVLPTVSQSRRYLTTIERGLGVVTRFDLDDGKVLGQVRTDESPDDDKAAYHSNPQDVHYVSDDSAWVSRWAPNPDASADERERGSDLIEFKPSTMKRTARRIDLGKFDGEVEEMQFDAQFKPTGTVTSVANARPASLVPAGDFLVVGLVRATTAFNYAPGVTVVIDPKSGQVTGSIALEGLSNCGDVRPVVGEPSQVLVGCIGAWGDAMAAGIVKLKVSDKGKPSIVVSYRVADHEGADNAVTGVVSLGKSKVVGTAPGVLDPKTKETTETDATYAIDLESGEQELLFESKGAFSIGVAAFDAETGVLLVPDAGGGGDMRYGVQRFRVDPQLQIEEEGFVEVAPQTTLAAREVRHL
jgi:hypothetical protein